MARRPLHLGETHAVLHWTAFPKPRYQLVVGRVAPGPREGTLEWRARGFFLSLVPGKKGQVLRRVGVRPFDPRFGDSGIGMQQYKGLVRPGVVFDDIIREGALRSIRHSWTFRRVKEC